MSAERFTTSGGVRIRYLDSSPAGRPAVDRGGPPPLLPLLFSPGFTDFADEYEEVLASFAPRRALVVEVRGRGGSDAPDAGYAASDHADDLAAVLDAEGIDRFHLMTFSRGTTWGLDLVLRRPDRVATVSIGDYWMAEHALDVSVGEQLMTTRFRGRPLRERVPAHVVPEVFRASRDRDLRSAVAATGLPVLVATGTLPGCLLTADYLATLRDLVPGVETFVVDGAAHDLFRPERLAYARAVQAFVARRAPGS